MPTRSDKVRRFRDLHEAGCFTIPNPWDVGGAKMMTTLGFEALATTSSGYAFSKGKRDMARDVDRDETLQYAAAIAAATHLPVTADTEDGYADTPEGVAETVRLAAEAGLAGLSIEDRQPNAAKSIRDFDDAVARVAVAVEAARKYDIVLTARADGLGRTSLWPGRGHSPIEGVSRSSVRTCFTRPRWPTCQRCSRCVERSMRRSTMSSGWAPRA